MYRNSKQRFSARRSSGQMLVVVAVALVLLIGMLGFVFDISRIELHRRQTQSAADAAAQAAAVELMGGTGSARIESALATAVSYAESNGVPADNVVVEIPPAGGPYANNNGFVRVRTVHMVPATLSRVFSGSATMEVAAYATAGVVPAAVHSTIVVLDPSQRGALRVKGDGTFHICNPPSYVNSGDIEAVVVEGTAQVSPHTLSVVGGVDYPVKVKGKLQTSGLPVPDPFAAVAAPTIKSPSEATLPNGSIVTTSPDSEGTAAAPTPSRIRSNTTLRPGIYWGGIVISDSAEVTLQPGVYIMAGGGFSVTSKRSAVSGTGVFIYNTRDPYRAKESGAFGDCAIKDSAVTLEAPTMAENPTYAGFLIFNDRLSATTISFDNATSDTGRGIPPDQAPIKGFVYSVNGRVELLNGGGSSGLGVVARTVMVDNGGVLGQADKDRIPRVPTVRLVD